MQDNIKYANRLQITKDEKVNIFFRVYNRGCAKVRKERYLRVMMNKTNETITSKIIEFKIRLGMRTCGAYLVDTELTYYVPLRSWNMVQFVSPENGIAELKNPDSRVFINRTQIYPLDPDDSNWQFEVTIEDVDGLVVAPSVAFYPPHGNFKYTNKPYIKSVRQQQSINTMTPTTKLKNIELKSLQSLYIFFRIASIQKEKERLLEVNCIKVGECYLPNCYPLKFKIKLVKNTINKQVCIKNEQDVYHVPVRNWNMIEIQLDGKYDGIATLVNDIDVINGYYFSVRICSLGEIYIPSTSFFPVNSKIGSFNGKRNKISSNIIDFNQYIEKNHIGDITDCNDIDTRKYTNNTTEQYSSDNINNIVDYGIDCNNNNLNIINDINVNTNNNITEYSNYDCHITEYIIDDDFCTYDSINNNEDQTLSEMNLLNSYLVD